MDYRLHGLVAVDLFNYYMQCTCLLLCMPFLCLTTLATPTNIHIKLGSNLIDVKCNGSLKLC